MNNCKSGQLPGNSSIIKWRPYSVYKDSGVEWLGQTPAHWGITPLKRYLTSLKDGTHGTFERILEGVPLLSAKNIGDGDILKVTEAESLISLEDYEIINRSGYLQLGDLLLTIVGTIGRAAIFNHTEPVAFQRSVAVLRPDHRISIKFLFFLSQSTYLQQALVSKTKRSAQGGIYLSDLATISIVIPPLEEQQNISQFLLQLTRKIDGLMARKERQIELLQEKRTTLITQAVTKGLNPTVPMKDSGVEWLGSIPAHWQVKRVKFLAEILRGKFSHRPRNAPELYDGPYPFIQTGDIANADKYIKEYQQTLNDLGFFVSKEFPRGTLVMSIAANIGDLAILEFPACFPDSIVGFFPKGEVDLNYLYYNLESMKQELKITAPLNTQQNLNIERVGSLKTVSLPINEQRKIAAHLDQEIAKIDGLISKIREGLDKLREYRTALISAAVTGKIDVREAMNS